MQDGFVLFLCGLYVSVEKSYVMCYHQIDRKYSQSDTFIKTGGDNMKRVFLIVLDSLGAGELPDAADYGDVGCGTIRSISKSDKFSIPNLLSLGIGNVDGLGFLGKTRCPSAATARLGELSKGKDTTIGHWEISGLISAHPLPTYPEGFPQEILDKLVEQTGREWLCNKPYSGTEVIKDYGAEHMETGKIIVYTSADSVLQIAAHNDVVPLEELYDICTKARAIMTGEHGVGRVIARPFTGEHPYTRTEDRRDFSIEPPGRTILNALSEAGRDVISVGKIKDVFVGSGITEIVEAHNNEEGMEAADRLVEKDFEGLCFINLVDFDMLYGHRQDVDGYAQALTEFDSWLGDFLPKLRDDDILIITADHGCDPGDNDTDHTREYVPMLVYGKEIAPIRLGTRSSFADIAATIAEWFGVYLETRGKSFARMVRYSRPSGGISDRDRERLSEMAKEAMAYAYSPYSGCKVGAALLAANGLIYTGCNIENAAFSPTNCAERTAIFKAVSEGVREFIAIAVAGGKNGKINGAFPPCGVCRQVMMEFCDPQTFEVLLVNSDGYSTVTLAELLPGGFGKDDVS